MGLDMLFSAERFFWIEDDAPVHNGHRVQSLRIEIGYLRKANAIHNWIVDNCGDGEDNCQDITIEIKQWKDLDAMCKRLLDLHKANPVKAVETALNELPPTPGFFFGSQEVDDFYWANLVKMTQIIKNAENNGFTKPRRHGFPAYTLIYRASW